MLAVEVQEARPQTALDAAPFHEWTQPGCTPWAQFHHRPGGYLLRFPGLADFEIDGDSLRVVCRPVPGVSQSVQEHLFRNQVWPLVQSHAGQLVFHASAVNLDGQAVAFVGQSGRGKSTLAAAFATSGRAFLTDDGLLVEPHGRGFRAVPSHPSLRLWADSRDALGADGVPADAPLHYTGKLRLFAGSPFAFCASPQPLSRAYFLGDGSADSTTIVRLSAAIAAMRWMEHSFLLDPTARPHLTAHFDRVAGLASRLPCYGLDFPRRFDALAEVRAAILEHGHSSFES